MTLIGMSIDVARAMLEREGYSVDIVENSRDKCKEYDSVLVTNAVLDGRHATLTVSPFLLEVGD